MNNIVLCYKLCLSIVGRYIIIIIFIYTLILSYSFILYRLNSLNQMDDIYLFKKHSSNTIIICLFSDRYLNDFIKKSRKFKFF